MTNAMEGDFSTWGYRYVMNQDPDTRDAEEPILEMNLPGISARKIAGAHRSPESREGRKGCREPRCPSARRGAEDLARAAPEGEGLPPYRYLDATYLKLRWGRLDGTLKRGGP